MQRYFIKIEGMGCDHCVQSVTGALLSLSANVHEVKLGFADVSFSGDESAMRSAIEDAGFDVVSISKA